MSFSPVRLNHAVLFVADLGRSLRFYTGVAECNGDLEEPFCDLLAPSANKPRRADQAGRR